MMQACFWIVAGSVIALYVFKSPVYRCYRFFSTVLILGGTLCLVLYSMGYLGIGLSGLLLNVFEKIGICI